MATWLHMVPEGRNTAASLPISAAMRSHSALMVGSSPCCSSPTSASIIAAFMAGLGRVWVSEYRLIRTGTEGRKGGGAQPGRLDAVARSPGGRGRGAGLDLALREGDVREWWREATAAFVAPLP